MEIEITQIEGEQREFINLATGEIRIEPFADIQLMDGSTILASTFRSGI